MSFHADLKFGNKYEKECVALFKGCGKPVFSVGNFSAYDVKFADGTTVEVKADRLAYRKKHICIEARCGRKLSGICATKADYWVHYVIIGGYGKSKGRVERVYKIPVGELKDLIAANLNKYELREGGDGNRSRMFMVPFRDIEKYEFVDVEKELESLGLLEEELAAMTFRGES